jgi:hypothetical protein
LKKRSNANALKKRLAELDAEVAACSNSEARIALAKRAEAMRSDLENAGYIHRRIPLKGPKNKKGKYKKSSQHVDPIVRAGNFATKGSYVRFVQGGVVRGK